MIATNIKNYSKEDIIVLLEGLQSGDVPYTLNDLKNLLSEITNRKLDSKYVNVLTSLMHDEITGTKPATESDTNKEAESSSVKRHITYTAPNYKDYEPMQDEQYERFPILNLLSGLYKVLAWFFLAAIILGSIIGSAIYYKNQALPIACCIFGGIVIGTIFLIIFYAQAEKLMLKLDIERHLRRK